jgi:hypothetical protein
MELPRKMPDWPKLNSTMQRMTLDRKLRDRLTELPLQESGDDAPAPPPHG